MSHVQLAAVVVAVAVAFYVAGVEGGRAVERRRPILRGCACDDCQAARFALRPPLTLGDLVRELDALNVDLDIKVQPREGA